MNVIPATMVATRVKAGAGANAASVATPLASAVKNSFATAVNTGGNGAEDYVPHLADYIARANGIK